MGFVSKKGPTLFLVAEISHSPSNRPAKPHQSYTKAPRTAGKPPVASSPAEGLTTTRSTLTQSTFASLSEALPSRLDVSSGGDTLLVVVVFPQYEQGTLWLYIDLVDYLRLQVAACFVIYLIVSECFRP